MREKERESLSHSISLSISLAHTHTHAHTHSKGIMISMDDMDEDQVQGWLHEVKMPEVVCKDLTACNGVDLSGILSKWTSASKRMRFEYICIYIYI